MKFPFNDLMKLVKYFNFCSNISKYYPRRVVVKLHERSNQCFGVYLCGLVELLLLFVNLDINSILTKNKKQNVMQKIQFLNVMMMMIMMILHNDEIHDRFSRKSFSMFFFLSLQRKVTKSIRRK